MAKELNLAIYYLLGSPATDATINPPYYVKVQLEVIAPFYDLDNAKKKRGCLKSWYRFKKFYKEVYSIIQIKHNPVENNTQRTINTPLTKTGHHKDTIFQIE